MDWAVLGGGDLQYIPFALVWEQNSISDYDKFCLKNYCNLFRQTLQNWNSRTILGQKMKNSQEQTFIRKKYIKSANGRNIIINHKTQLILVNNLSYVKNDYTTFINWLAFFKLMQKSFVKNIFKFR